MRSWLPALRIARREARRAKGRSALVLSMIALPVLFLSFVAANVDMFALTPAEQADRFLGTADASLSWDYDGPIQQSPDGNSMSSQVAVPRTKPVTAAELLASLPPGSRVTGRQQGVAEVHTPDGVGHTNGLAVDLADPMVHGIVNLLQGTAPVRDDQVTINAPVAKWLGVGIGGTVRTTDPERSYTVSGIVELPDSLHGQIVFRPSAGPAGLTFANWLVDTPEPIDWTGVKQLNTRGIQVTSRAVMLDPPQVDPDQYGGSMSGVRAPDLALGALVAGLTMLEIVLLAGPAFAVGARRRSRELALIAATGGSPAHLRRVVLADGVVLGLAGAVIGIVGGIGLAVAGRPLIEEYVSHARAGGWRFFPTALLGIAALAVATGLLAALLPAFTAARQNVVMALAGRRGQVRSRKRWIVVASVMILLGAGLAATGAFMIKETLILSGLVLAQLGLVLLTPALVGLIARVGRWLPLSSRIAMRETSRNRSSAAPAISAVMAAVAGAVAVGVVVGSQNQQQFDSYQQQLPLHHIAVNGHIYSGPPESTPGAVDWAGIVAAVRSAVPGSDPHLLDDVGCAKTAAPPAKDVFCTIEMYIPESQQCPFWSSDYEPSPQQQREAKKDKRCRSMRRGNYFSTVVDDGGSLAALTAADPGDIALARRTLAAGGVVVTDPRYLIDGKITLTPLKEVTQVDPKAKLPTISVPGTLIGGTPSFNLMIPPQLVERLGLSTTPMGMVAATDHPPTGAEEERLTKELRDISNMLGPNIERGATPHDEPSILVLALAAALIALGAAGIATGLAAADSRADLGTLAAVGASPGVRRRLSLSQAGVIAGMGSLLGILSGVGIAAALIITLNEADPVILTGGVPLRLVMPWNSVAVVLAVPLVAMAGAGLLTRSRLPIERRF